MYCMDCFNLRSFNPNASEPNDPGIVQFCDRYETVSADLETRRNYILWFNEMLREEGMIDAVRQEYELRLVEAKQKLVVDLAEAEQKRVVDLA